jgi:hypothetical protein
MKIQCNLFESDYFGIKHAILSVFGKADAEGDTNLPWVS